MIPKLDLKTCNHCALKYPADLLHPFVVNGRYKGPICGICALEVTNEHAGMDLKRFMGKKAESNRLRAIEWRMRNQL